MDNNFTPKPKLKLNRVKRTNWPEEVQLNSLAVDLSEDGWYITCKACKDYGYPIGKHRLKMRHAYGPTRFFDHINNVEYHKKAVLFQESTSRQPSMKSFFTKKPRLATLDHDNDYNESISPSESSPSLSKLQDLLISCEGIFTSKENSLAKKVLTLSHEFIKIPSSSLYEFNTHKGHLCLQHKNCNGKGIHKLKGSNPFIYQCTFCHSLRAKKGGSNPRSLLFMRFHNFQKTIDRRTKLSLTSSDVHEIKLLSHTNPEYCTDAGNELIQESVAQLKYIEEVLQLRKKLQSAPIFESIDEDHVLNVDPTLNKLAFTLTQFPNFKDSLLMCLLRAAMVKVHQNQSSLTFSDKVLNFFQLIRTHSPKCADVVSANLFGPSKRYIQRINSKENIPSIIIGSKEVIVETISEVISSYQKSVGSKVCVSLFSLTSFVLIEKPSSIYCS